MEEIWKDIKGYEGLYQVSNLGRVKSMLRKVPHLGGYRTIPERIVKFYLSSTTGYYMIKLCKNNIYKLYLVHRLVAEAFVSNPNNWPYINHKDEDRTNNKATNLEWCTPNYNIEYSHVREKSINKISIPVEQYDYDGNLIATYKSSVDAGKTLDVAPSSIRRCCNGEIGSVKGFLWKSKGIDKIVKTPARCRRVLQKDMQGNVIKIWNSIKEAADNTKSSICGILACCQGKRNKTSNYFKWEYYDKLPVTTI